MWDLTIPGNNDHDFYVLVDAAPVALSVLVHNVGPTCSVAGLHSAVDRMEAGLGGSLIDMTGDGDPALRIYPKLPSAGDARADGEPFRLPRYHAESKLLTESVNLGMEPLALVTSRDFCEYYCVPMIERFGGAVVTPRLALWPRLSKVMAMMREGS